MTDHDQFTTTFNSQVVRNHIFRISQPTLTHLRPPSTLRWCVITYSDFLDQRWPIYDHFQLSVGAWLQIPNFSTTADPFTTTFNSQGVGNHIFWISRLTVTHLQPLSTLRRCVITYSEFLDWRWPIYDHFQLSEGVWTHILNFSTDADPFMTTFNSQGVRDHIFSISQPTLTHLWTLSTLRRCVIKYSEFLDRRWTIYDHFQISVGA